MSEKTIPVSEATSESLESQDHEAVIAATRHWLTRAVIGLNLCPFAKAVHVKDQIRYVVSAARDMEGALLDLERELQGLAEADPQEIDTTLLILPYALLDFHEYNDALFFAERMLKQLHLEGELQIASFHPDYQFEGTTPDDAENYTNRSPYPILHLLRESSIDRAVEAFPEAETIFERNEALMRKMGVAGYHAWMAQPAEDEDGANDNAMDGADEASGKTGE
ncbi:peptidase [Pandoraea fibrosis]|uniref:Peptidase n=1 Tax=Pandoraea fibrosis TaxID=1891094 RepID=A0A5E4YK58_9BURK|nr:peptidase [Pandoraea fibrosis]